MELFDEIEPKKPASLPPLFDSQGAVYCPICKKSVGSSDYLKTVIQDERVLWIANMITHYRHNHITSWNKCWGRGGGRYRNGWFGDYDEEKKLVNERAKRQIIRKCKHYLMLHEIKAEHYEQLQSNDEKTIALAKTTLG